MVRAPLEVLGPVAIRPVKYTLALVRVVNGLLVGTVASIMVPLSPLLWVCLRVRSTPLALGIMTVSVHRLSVRVMVLL